MTKKRVLFISHLSYLNGAEKSLYTLIKGLLKDGAVLPILLAPCDGPLVKKIESLSVSVIISKYFFWTGSKNKCFIYRIARLFLNAFAVLRLSGKLKNLDLDLIYTNTLATPVGAIVAKLLKIPHIWHAREFISEDFNGLYDLGETISMTIINKLSSVIVCNSRAVENKLHNFKNWEKPTIVIYNGFDFSKIKPVDAFAKYDQCFGSEKSVNLLIAGSINPGKGQQDAILATAILLKKGYQVHLSIAGTGKQKYINYLQSIITREQLGKRVDFLGYIADINSLYQKAGITLICSVNEAFGRAAVESLALGTPVIGTCKGGLPEIIQPNITGLLYEPGCFASLANKIEKLILDRNLYARLSSDGQAYVVDKFSEDQYINQIKAVLYQHS